MQKENSKLIVLTYHRVAKPNKWDVLSPRIISSTPDNFNFQMSYLKKYYNVITIQQIFDFLNNGLTFPRRAVLITFDDAYSDFLDHAWPVLNKLNLPVTIFVPTAYPDNPERSFWWDRLYHSIALTSKSSIKIGTNSFLITNAERKQNVLKKIISSLASIQFDEALDLVDKICFDLGVNGQVTKKSVLDWHELQQLAEAGVTIGAHTRTHPILNQLPEKQIIEEVRGSQDDLSNKIGKVYPIFAYPNNHHSDVVLKVLRQEGFIVGFNGPGGINDMNSVNLLRIRRINITRRTTKTVFCFRLVPFFTRVDKYRLRHQIAENYHKN